MKKILTALLAAALTVCLCAGCGAGEAPRTTPVPEASALPEPADSPAPADTPSAIPAMQESAPSPTAADVTGSYVYDDGTTLWTLMLRDSGTYTIQARDDVPHTGESWSLNPDGTVSCGPTDLWTQAFADSYGCTVWTLSDDGRCAPVLPD